MKMFEQLEKGKTGKLSAEDFDIGTSVIIYLTEL